MSDPHAVLPAAHRRFSGGPRSVRRAAASACLLTVLLLAPACLGPAARDADAAAPTLARDQVIALLTRVAADLASEGPEAWERHAAPEFSMASDGALAFADRAALVAFVRGYDGQVERMALDWRGLEVLPLAADRAWFGGEYQELIVHTDGDEDRFGGYVTGLAVQRDGTWLLERMHWSSPRTPDGD